MSPFDPLARRVFAPLYDRRHGLADPRLRAEVEASQRWPAERLRDLQWERLRDLLAHAASKSPFYRERFAALGLEPGDVDSWEAFARLPLLTKDDVRDRLDDLIVEGLRKDDLFHKRTGGSTGVPVHLYWDPGARRLKHALTARHDAWAGYERGMRRAALWGDTEKDLTGRQRLYRALAERTIYLDTLLMDEAHLDRFFDRVRAFRPENLIGHGHSLFFLAKVVKERGAEDIRFGSIISTAENLSREERALVEEVFGPVVFDRYGCEEVSIIASECEAHDGLHVAAEGLVVEILDGSESEPGRVVVTDLANRAMPFIRYEVGDLATTRSGPCACGRGLPRLGRVHGRTSDILYAPDGTRVSGISILDTFMIHIPGVKQAQLVQEEMDRLRILVVPDARYGEATRERIGSVVSEVFGPSMRWTLEQVDTIPRTPRGKFQFTICRVKPDEVGLG